MEDHPRCPMRFHSLNSWRSAVEPTKEIIAGRRALVEGVTEEGQPVPVRKFIFEMLFWLVALIGVRLGSVKLDDCFAGFDREDQNLSLGQSAAEGVSPYDSFTAIEHLVITP